MSAGVIALDPLTERHRVPSEAMLPTLQIGDVINVNRGVYRNAPPEVRDIVVLHPPQGAERSEPRCGIRRQRGQACPKPTPQRSDALYVKRVVAGPGDRVAGITVPPGHYFVMGDNRGASFDSRHWGPVPRAWILGRVERCRLVVLACSLRR